MRTAAQTGIRWERTQRSLLWPWIGWTTAGETARIGVVLRRHVARAGRWVLITAAAWLGGLTVFLLVASPLWQEGQPLAVT